MNNIEILKNARELVAKGWTQEVAARLPSGERTFSTDPEAVCFCTSGAFNRVLERSLPHDLDTLTVYLESVIPIFKQVNGIRHVIEWNDDPQRTQAEVVAAFDNAIKYCETVTDS